ncbi:hypothetical protein BofuT4_P084130.1 [Botrytis cinerea T4]|uniref:Uncharacterized protein n=1 Tax=Botryotinia fuckeliana (strain T4) TaxID=999810 RepID=G2YJH2_BOTF4|nr:hypothetical protein BofuT4_P084130.1 [Botrytis cinerea T4]
MADQSMAQYTLQTYHSDSSGPQRTLVYSPAARDSLVFQPRAGRQWGDLARSEYLRYTGQRPKMQV